MMNDDRGASNPRSGWRTIYEWYNKAPRSIMYFSMDSLFLLIFYSSGKDRDDFFYQNS